MTTSANVADILNSTLKAISEVITNPMTNESPQLLNSPVHQAELGVMVGFTGAAFGRLVLTSEEMVFGLISEGMYGMRFDGEMLHSFTGELGNMIAGHAATVLSGKGML